MASGAERHAARCAVLAGSPLPAHLRPERPGKAMRASPDGGAPTGFVDILLILSSELMCLVDHLDSSSSSGIAYGIGHDTDK